MVFLKNPLHTHVNEYSFEGKIHLVLHHISWFLWNLLPSAHLYFFFLFWNNSEWNEFKGK